MQKDRLFSSKIQSLVINPDNYLSHLSKYLRTKPLHVGGIVTGALHCPAIGEYLGHGAFACSACHFYCLLVRTVTDSSIPCDLWILFSCQANFSCTRRRPLSRPDTLRKRRWFEDTPVESSWIGGNNRFEGGNVLDQLWGRHKVSCQLSQFCLLTWHDKYLQ